MNLSIVPALVGGAFVAPYLNTVVRCRKGAEHRPIVHLMTDMIRWWFWVVPLIAVAVVSAPEIIDLIYGRAFMASAPIFGVLLVAVYAQVFLTFSIATLVALDRPRWTVRVVAPMTLLGLVAQFFMIPRFGLIGAALVVLIGTVAAALLFFMLLGRLRVLDFPWRSLFNAGVASIVVTLSSWYWPVTGVLVIIKLIALTVMVFVLLVVLGEPLSHQVKTMWIWMSRIMNVRD
jgi:O-antigen/teichoic acid export membrane protein